MTIRDAVLADARQIRDIYAYYVENSSFSFELLAPDTVEYARRMQEVLSFYPFLVLEEDGEILGFAYAHAFHERRAYRFVCETSVYVKNAMRQRGVATKLYESLLEALKRQGFTKAIAILSCPNEPSEGLHKKLGFALCAHFPDMGYKFDEWRGIKWYILDLNPAKEAMEEPIAYKDL